MADLDLMSGLSEEEKTKILLVVLDGLGGLPMTPEGPTELEAAQTPNLDGLAARSICGMSTAVAPGISPGSGPGHLSLFGYDPIECLVKRGVLSALGIGFDLQPGDLAARGNFCSVDPETGKITDRRAGRIGSDLGTRLCEKLNGVQLPDVDRVFVKPVKEYRFTLILRGEGLEDGLTDTDPQETGVPPLPVKATRPEAEETAELINRWLEKAREVLAEDAKEHDHPANSCNLRGLAKEPGLPQMPDIYKMRCACIATYPMYKGVARLAGMDILSTGAAIEEEVATLREKWEGYDFFFFHVKEIDSRGEDGDFEAKAAVIEHFDEVLPDMLALEPDVVIITGDHSTPALWKNHSWHELPVLLHSRFVRRDDATTFGERACMRGGLGHIRHVDLLPLAMAHAGRLKKYGA